jgi:hypothetical protein
VVIFQLKTQNGHHGNERKGSQEVQASTLGTWLLSSCKPTVAWHASFKTPLMPRLAVRRDPSPHKSCAATTSDKCSTWTKMHEEMEKIERSTHSLFLAHSISLDAPQAAVVCTGLAVKLKRKDWLI